VAAIEYEKDKIVLCLEGNTDVYIIDRERR
jgi:hypothetical protein